MSRLENIIAYVLGVIVPNIKSLDLLVPEIWSKQFFCNVGGSAGGGGIAWCLDWKILLPMSWELLCQI